jgi:predicted dehydrogenase
MTQLNLGVLGLGEATQILHLPALRQLPGLFRIGAVYDPAEQVMSDVGAQLPGATLYDSAENLLADPQIDAVLVVGPNASHAPQALAALEGGKHVLVEKPMCVTLQEADVLEQTQARTRKVVQIGYMRRYAPAFEQAVKLVEPHRDRITFARVRDIIGPNSAFIAPTSNVMRGAVPDALKRQAADTEASAIRMLAGTDSGPRAVVARLLLGLSTHDISAMREMLGMPKRVLSAYFRQDGLFVTVQFDYGSFICQFETGIDKLARFDAEIEVLTPDQAVKVLWDTPYIRNQPTKLCITRQNTEYGVETTESYPSRQDSFIPEWERFHAAITKGDRVKTDIPDARLDLEILHEIMQKLEG